MSHETFYVSFRPGSLRALETGLDEIVKKLEDEFADDDVIRELREFECEIRARLQHIEAGNVQIATPPL
jgi:hypothetical protein